MLHSGALGSQGVGGYAGRGGQDSYGGGGYGGGGYGSQSMSQVRGGSYSEDPYRGSYGGGGSSSYPDGGGYGAPPPPPPAPPARSGHQQYGQQQFNSVGGRGGPSQYEDYGFDGRGRGDYEPRSPQSPHSPGYGSLSANRADLHGSYQQDRHDYGYDDHGYDERGHTPFGKGDPREFFVILHLDHQDRQRHATMAAKERGRQVAGSAGTMFGSMLGAVTGGAAVSDQAVADMVLESVEDTIRLVMRRQRWEVRSSTVMMPPSKPGNNDWKSYMIIQGKGGMLMAFRVQAVRRSKDDTWNRNGCIDFFGACKETCCPPGPPSFSRRNSAQVCHEIQDVLRRRHPPITAMIDIGNANEMCQTLQELKISPEIAEHVVTAARGAGYNSPASGGGSPYSQSHSLTPSPGYASSYSPADRGDRGYGQTYGGGGGGGPGYSGRY